MPDFAIDYGLLHEARKDLHELADRVGPRLGDSVFAQVGGVDYPDADPVFGDEELASAFRSLYQQAQHPMDKAEDDLRELGDIFGAIADGYFDVDAQIANGMGMMGASLGLDEWRRKKSEWDFFQEHRGECTPDPDGSVPDFCHATDPGPPQTDFVVDTGDGSVKTHLTLDENYNVVKEETTVISGDQRYTSVSSYSDGGKTQTTDTTFADGSTSHSVTKYFEHGSSATDTTAGDGSTSHTEITLDDNGGGTMVVSGSDGSRTEYKRPDQNAKWETVSDIQPDTDPIIPDA